MKLIPFDRTWFGPATRGGQGHCAYDFRPAVKMTQQHQWRLALCAEHAGRFEARQQNERLECPFCDKPALAGEPCPHCGVALPADARDARQYAVRQNPRRAGSGPRTDNWDGSTDNTARQQEEA